MSWYRVALADMDAEVDQQVKQLIRQQPFFKKLFQHYKIDIKDLWQVRFHVARVGDNYAASRGNDIYLDPVVLEYGLERSLHMIAHELSHWLTRKQKENEYFSDPEEIDGFVWGIACELSLGRSMDEIEDTFTPLIAAQIKGGESEARKMLLKMILLARRLAK